MADLADIMWLATGAFGADLSKDFSKKVLEIVLDTEILAPRGEIGRASCRERVCCAV